MPKKLASQIILLILFMLLSTQLLIFFVFISETDYHANLKRNIKSGQYITKMVSATNVLENSKFRDSFHLSAYREKFYVIDEPLFEVNHLTKESKVLSHRLQTQMGEDYPNAAMQQLYIPQSRFHIAYKHFGEYLQRFGSDKINTYSNSVLLQSQVQLKNGRWAVMLVLDIYPYPNWIATTLAPLFIFTIIFILFSIIMVLGITNPLVELAKKAHKLGIGEETTEIKLRGPSDIQNLIIAFNQMLKRVTNVNDHRARALAAISHDIRTPLTSMRLDAEFIAEQDVQENIFNKIDEMEQICEATVTFALQDSWSEKNRVFDMVSLVDSICLDLSEQGLDVDFELTDRINFSGRPVALKRAITNLIKNGVQYGNSVQVSMVKLDNTIEVHILDNGKGIPEDKMELLFSPFERLENSRNRNSGGLGLGMAIARSAVRSHGGEIELENIAGKGLKVVVIIPIPRSLID